MTEIENNKSLLGLTVEIVSAHIRNNTVQTGALPALIEQVYAALRDAGRRAPVSQAASVPPAKTEPERSAPAVSPKKSVFPDYIICLEDGRKLKTLKRHLRSTYNMTPEQYREKWELAADYPMVAPSYAEHRSALAKKLGLGRKSAAKAEPVRNAAPPAAPREAPVAPPPLPFLSEAPPERRPEHTAASVFAKFPIQAEPEPTVQTVEPSPGKSRRKPFSKQLARSMRP